MKNIFLQMTNLTLFSTLLLMGTAAKGSTLLSLDLETLTKDADQIVAGRVLDAVSFKRENRIYTLHQIRVSTVAAGNAAVGQIVEVVTEGGKIGNIRQAVSGAATLEVGEEYLFFLEMRGDPPFAYLVGMTQGAYALIRDVNTSDVSIRPPTNLPRLVTRDIQSSKLIETGPWLTENRLLDEVLRAISQIRKGVK